MRSARSGSPSGGLSTNAACGKTSHPNTPPPSLVLVTFIFLCCFPGRMIAAFFLKPPSDLYILIIYFFFLFSSFFGEGFSFGKFTTLTASTRYLAFSICFPRVVAPINRRNYFTLNYQFGTCRCRRRLQSINIGTGHYTNLSLSSIFTSVAGPPSSDDLILRWVAR